MHQRPPTEPKPFFWIPLKEKPALDRPPDLDRFTDESGGLELQLEVLSDYLHVGSGQFELKTIGGREQAHYAFARRDEKLVIPGSSLKGAVRAVLEALSNSCLVVQRGSPERIPSSHRPCSSDGLFCPACRLFGTTRRRGRVHFSDAVAVGAVRGEVIKIGDLWPPRNARGRKFYRSGGMPRHDLTAARNFRFIEAVHRGSRFASVLYFENVRPAEMGLVLRAMGFDLDDAGRVVQAFPIKVGGAKPRCLGAVRFNVTNLRLVRPGPGLLSALAGEGSSVAREQVLREWLSAPSEDLLDRKAWELFRRNAAKEEGWCPQELY